MKDSLFCPAIRMALGLAIAMLVATQSAHSQTYCDSLMKYASNTSGNIFSDYATKALAQSADKHCDSCRAHIYFAQGIQEYERGYMTNSNIYFLKASHLYDSLGMAAHLLRCRSMHLVTLAAMGEPGKMAPISVAKDSVFAENVIQFFYGQSYYYITHEKYDSALFSIDKSIVQLKGKEQTDAKVLFAKALCTRALIEYSTKAHENALKSCLEALRFARENQIDEVLPAINAQLSHVFLEKGDYNRAISCINKAIYSDSLNNKQANVAVYYYQKAEIYQKMNVMAQSVLYFEASAQLAQLLWLNPLQKMAYDRLIEISTITENYDKIKLYKKLKNSTT